MKDKEPLSIWQIIDYYTTWILIVALITVVVLALNGGVTIP